MTNSFYGQYLDQMYTEEEKKEVEQIVPAQPVVKEEESKDSTPNQPDQKPESSSKEEEQPKQEEKKTAQEIYRGEESPIPYSGGSLYEDVGPLKEAAEMTAVGTAQTLSGLVNLIPGVNAPAPPKYEDELKQAGASIAGDIALTLTGGGLISLFGKAMRGISVGTKFGRVISDPFVQRASEAFGTYGSSIAATAGSPSSEDHNLTGALKKNFPSWWGWLPQELATLDRDAPDQKRNKNIYENAGIGFFTDILQVAAPFLRKARGAKPIGFKPESEQAKKYFADKLKPKTSDGDIDINKLFDIDPPAKARTEALDELGVYNMTKSANLDEPILGVHDVYNDYESATRGLDNMGVIGAAVDEVRIARNIDTVNGRVGSVITEPTLKGTLDGYENYQKMIKGLTKSIQLSDKYGYETASGTYIPHSLIVKQGEELAEEMYGLSKTQLKALYKAVSEADPDTRIPNMPTKFYKATLNLMRKYVDDYANMDYMRANRYLSDSIGGQLADQATVNRSFFANGAELGVGSAIERGREKVLDMIEFLMIQKGMTSYVRGRALNFLNFFNRIKDRDFDGLKDMFTNDTQGAKKALEKIMRDAKSYRNLLEEVRTKRPEWLEPLMFAIEVTDGKVKTIEDVMGYWDKSTRRISKALIDLEPDIPNIVKDGIWASVYNNTLYAIATPVKAWASAEYTALKRPIDIIVGGVVGADVDAIKKGVFGLRHMGVSLKKAHRFAWDIYRRSENPKINSVISPREEIIKRNENQMKLLNSIAEAESKAGNDGLKAYLAQIEQLYAVADSSIARHGNRALLSADAMTNMFVADQEAWMRAYEKVNRYELINVDGKAAKSPLEMFTERDLMRFRTEYLNEMFEKDETYGMLVKDKHVNRISGELALNADNALSTGLSAMLRRVPALKPLLLFTKTPANEMFLTASNNPVGLIMRQYNDYAEPFAKTSASKAEKVLAKQGIPMDEFTEHTWNTRRAEMMGRKAITGSLVTSAGFLYFDGRVTGDQTSEASKRRFRDQHAKVPRRSVKGLDGKWYSYDWMMGTANWIAFVANVMDEFVYGHLSETDLTKALGQATFALTAAVSTDSTLKSLEPLFDVLDGDFSAMNRWASAFLPSVTMPGSNLLAEVGRNLQDYTKIVENDFTANTINRTLLRPMLPDQYDWIDGGRYQGSSNPIEFLLNKYTPFKTAPGLTPRKQYLVDVEFDATPYVTESSTGVKYTYAEQEAILKEVGDFGYFGAQLDRIMKDTPADTFRKDFKTNASDPRYEADKKSFDNLHIRIGTALRKAVDMAELTLAQSGAIRLEGTKKETAKEYDVRGGQQTKEYLDKFNGNY